MRWKLLILSLFSVFLLEKSDVKFTLFRKRFKVLGKNVNRRAVEEAIDYPAPYLEGVDVAFEKVIGLEHLDDLSFELLHETVVQKRELVDDLAEFLKDDFFYL